MSPSRCAGGSSVRSTSGNSKSTWSVITCDGCPALAGNVVRNVERIVGNQLIQEPQPFLGEGQRQLVPARHPRHRQLAGTRSAVARRFEQRAQLGDSPRFEQRAQRQFNGKPALHAGDDLDGQQRVATEFKEVVKNADRANP